MTPRYSPTGRGRPAGAWTAAGLRPHGTRAARRRHRYRGEPLCPACQTPAERRQVLAEALAGFDCDGWRHAA